MQKEFWSFRLNVNNHFWGPLEYSLLYVNPPDTHDIDGMENLANVSEPQVSHIE